MYPKPDFIIVGINFAPEPTGNAPYTTDLAEQMSKTYDVRVVTGVPHYPWWRKVQVLDDSALMARLPNLELVRVNHFVPKNPTHLRRLLMEVSFGIKTVFTKKLMGDVVLLVSPALIASAIVVLSFKVFRKKAKTALWVQDLYAQGLKETSGRDGFTAKILNVIESWLFRNVDQVVLAHESFVTPDSVFASLFHKVVIVRNWSQFSFFPTEDRVSTRSRYGFGEKTVILHIGNMGVKQGLDSVVSAAHIAMQDQTPINFVLVGSGNQEASLKKQAGNCPNLLFVPPVNEVELSNLLQAADFLLVNEKPGVKLMSVPSKLTTYFQTGVPVVVCSHRDSISSREVLVNNLGYQIESGDPNTFLKQLMEIDLGEAKRKASMAQLHSKSKLSRTTALEKFMFVLENLRRP